MVNVDARSTVKAPRLHSAFTIVSVFKQESHQESSGQNRTKQQVREMNIVLN